MTERSEYRCVVKEGSDGEPFLVFEPLRGEQPRALKGKLVSIDLRAGTTYEQQTRVGFSPVRRVER
jgi:hypothetical protein